MCIYEESVEDLLYEKRRDLIQVTGRVLFGEQGAHKQIIDVTDIRDLDLLMLTLDTVRHGTLTIKAEFAEQIFRADSCRVSRVMSKRACG